jgi:hypothetical protein
MNNDRELPEPEPMSEAEKAVWECFCDMKRDGQSIQIEGLLAFGLAAYLAGLEAARAEVNKAELAKLTEWANLFASGDNWKVEDEIHAILKGRPQNREGK